MIVGGPPLAVADRYASADVFSAMVEALTRGGAGEVLGGGALVC